MNRSITAGVMAARRVRAEGSALLLQAGGSRADAERAFTIFSRFWLKTPGAEPA